MTSVWRTERDVPSLLERVEQVMQECTERFEKVEEHEVKLGLSLSRLATVDQRLQSCMDRIERLPATTQADRSAGPSHRKGCGPRAGVHEKVQIDRASLWFSFGLCPAVFQFMEVPASHPDCSSGTRCR